MKKFWIVLLSMGLLAAFSIPAFAIDVKFSGEYRVRGWYDNNPSGLEKNAASAAFLPERSASFYDQRLRMTTDFVIAEGLTLTTRFDALEKKWGDTSFNAGRSPATGWAAPTGGDSSGRLVTDNGLSKQQENIEFERAYVTFKSPIGLWQVGYQMFLNWGPDPANSSTTRPGIIYILPIGNSVIVAAIEKGSESDIGGDIGRWSDADQDIYDLGYIYKLGKTGDVGLLIQHVQDRSGRPQTALVGDLGAKKVFTVFDPYVRLNFGPVYFEAEGIYLTGDAEFDNEANAKLIGKEDMDLEEIAIFMHARVDLAPVYFGVYAGYGSGDDITTNDEMEGHMGKALKAGSDFKPCLMLFNYDYATQFAGTTGVASLGSYMDNILFGQVYVGFKPTPKLDVRFSYSYAEADEPEVANQDEEYGSEIDVTASYKIYDNLEYMVGGAYFMTGDFFKRGVAAVEVEDDYMLMHKLTLKF